LPFSLKRFVYHYSLNRNQRSKTLKDIDERATEWRASSAYHIARDPSQIRK